MQLARDEIIKKYTVTREKRASAYNMPNAHYHDHYEIYFLTKGSVRYFVENRIFDLNEGDAILISPHVIHKTATLKNSGVERIVIAFTNEFIMSPPGDRIFSCFENIYFNNPPIGELVFKAEKEFLREDRYSEELLSSYIREILIKLTRLNENSSAETVSHNYSIIQKAVQYICENYHSELTLPQLSLMFNLSESYFSRQFKAYTGFGLNEYITLVRVKNAESLLSTTKISVTDISSMCGFNSSSYFTAVFRKIKGITPVKLRKRKGEKQNEKG